MSAAGWEVHYILLNPSWPEFLGGHRIDNANRPRGRTSYGEGLTEYLVYLRNSVRALLMHGPEGVSLVVDVVALDGQPCPEAAIRNACQGLPQDRLRVQTLAGPAVRDLVARELARPAAAHRSPNAIHEYALYHLLLHSQHPRLAILDVDTLMLKPGLLEWVAADLEQNPQRCAAAFTEPERAGGSLRARMHTVALFFDTARSRLRFPLGQDAALLAGGLSRLELLRDPAVRAHYQETQRMDALSMLTEQMLQEGEPSPLLDLNRCSGTYFETDGLILGCEFFVHAKYLERIQFQALKGALGRHPEDARNFLRTFNRVVSG
jgi:hypothetical protein